MTVRLTPKRKNELLAHCKALLNKSKCTIRKFAKLIGLMVASELGVEHAPLFYKPLEKIKEEPRTVSYSICPNLEGVGGKHFSKTFSIFYMLKSKNRVFNPYFSFGTCPMRKLLLRISRGLNLLSFS